MSSWALRLFARCEEGGKPGNAAVGELLVAEDHRRAHGRRGLALLVGKARADRELHAACQTDHERAQTPLMTPRARLVGDHDRLVVLERLHLEERGGATGH